MPAIVAAAVIGFAVAWILIGEFMPSWNNDYAEIQKPKNPRQLGSVLIGATTATATMLVARRVGKRQSDRE